jgi:hypothetical protein
VFIRKQVVKKGSISNTYLKLVENYRPKGNVVQKTLVNFGNISHWPQEKVRELIFKLPQVMDIELPPSLENIEHRGVLNFGQPLALDLLWDGKALGETLERLLAISPFAAPIKATVFNLKFGS